MPSKKSSIVGMVTESEYYPFNLTGPLCPLIADPDLLVEFYDDAQNRQSIKQFCKKRSWKGKPPVSHSVGSEQLKKLLKSLFDSAEAREKLREMTGNTGKGKYLSLDGAIWRWLKYRNKPLSERLDEYGFVDDDVKDTHVMLDSFLKELKKEELGPQLVKHLAYFVLAYSVFKEEDRFELGKTFIKYFPGYKESFCLSVVKKRPHKITTEPKEKQEELQEEIKIEENTQSIDLVEMHDDLKSLNIKHEYYNKINEASKIQIAELKDDINVNDQRFEEIIVHLRKRRAVRKDLKEELLKLVKNARSETEKIASDYPFKIDQKDILRLTENIADKSFDGIDWDIVKKDLSSIFYDVAKDEEILSKYIELNKEYTKLHTKSNDEGVEFTSTSPILETVLWENRIEKLEKYNDDLTESIELNRAAIALSKESAQRIKEVKEQLEKVNLENDVISDFDIHKLPDVLYLIDKTHHDSAFLSGIVIFIILYKNRQEGISVFEEFLNKHQSRLDFCHGVLSVLPIECLSEVSKHDVSLSRSIIFFIFSEAYFHSNFSLLKLFREVIDFLDEGTVKRFFRSLLYLIDRQQLTSRNQLVSLLKSDKNQFKAQLHSIKAEFLNFVIQKPGMKGIFHELRVHAWRLYFHDLEKAVEEKSDKIIKEQLHSLEQAGMEGLWKEIVDQTDLKPKTKLSLNRSFTDKRYVYTVRYIEEGLGYLKNYLALLQIENEKKYNKWEELRDIAHSFSDTKGFDFGDVDWLERSMHDLLFQDSGIEAAGIEEKFGEMVSTDSSDPWESKWYGVVDATMPRAFYASSKENVVSLRQVANDFLYKLISKQDLKSLLRHYQSNNGVLFASLALEDFKINKIAIPKELSTKIEEEVNKLCQNIHNRLEVQKKKIKDLHKNEREEAKERVSVIESSIEDKLLAEAEEWLSDLEEYQRKIKNRDYESVRKLELIEWLEKVGFEKNLSDLSVTELQNRKNEFLTKNKDRLLHVEVLSSFSKEKGFSDEFRNILKQVAETLQMPKYWPETSTDTEYIVLCLEEILKKLVSWCKVKTVLDSDAQISLSILIGYFEQNILQLVSNAVHGNTEESNLAEIAELGWENVQDPEEIRKVLFKKGFLKKEESEIEEITEDSEAVDPLKDVYIDWLPLINAAKEEKETLAVGNPFTILDNRSYRKLASPSASEYRRLDSEGRGETKEAFRFLGIFGIACLLDGRQLQIETVENYVDCIASLLYQHSELKDHFAESVWKQILNVDNALAQPPGWKRFIDDLGKDPARNIIVRLMSGFYSFEVFEALWDKGKLDRENSLRISLLCLLEQEENWRTLNIVILKLAPKQIQNLLRNFVNVLKSTAQDDTAEQREANLTILADHIENQAKKLSSVIPYLPWIDFTRRNVVTNFESDPLTEVRPETGELEKVEKGRWLFQLHIKRRHLDYPASLEISLGEGSKFNLLDGEKPKDILKIDEPSLLDSEFVQDLYLIEKERRIKPGEPVDLVLRLSGSTLTGRTFGREYILPAKLSDEPEFEIPGSYEIEEAYPGAVGNPVLRGEGFFGRDNILHNIDSAILNGESNWITGIRRIGKTSILLQIAKDYSFEANREAAPIYYDVATFNYQEGKDATYQAQFFGKLRNALLTHERNKSFCTWLMDHGVDKQKLEMTLRAIGKDQDGDLSTWLPELSNCLVKLSNNKISRILFLLDEVEKFEAHWRLGYKDKVKTMLFSLRNVIQQAENISIFFAGSNLANRFITDYDQPFFGSIKNESLEGFNFERDFNAIKSVFLPITMQSYFHVSDDVLKYVNAACKGIPYFIAMLGKTVCEIAAHRRITKIVIDKAIKVLMWGSDSVRISAAYSSFTKSLQDLTALNEYEQVRAELFLMIMAQNASLAFPTVDDELITKIAASEAPSVETNEWNEARKQCIDVGLITGPRIKLRFTIPIMGEALKRMASEMLRNRIEDLELLRD